MNGQRGLLDRTVHEDASSVILAAALVLRGSLVQKFCRQRQRDPTFVEAEVPRAREIYTCIIAIITIKEFRVPVSSGNWRGSKEIL